jgi:hypothetical protein
MEPGNKLLKTDEPGGHCTRHSIEKASIRTRKEKYMNINKKNLFLHSGKNTADRGRRNS